MGFYYDLILKFKLSFYFRKQLVDADYKITVVNRSENAENISLVFPIPPNTPFQSITESKINLKGEIKEDSQYKNKYFVGQLSLKPKQTKIINHHFKACLLPNISNGKLIFQNRPTTDNRFIQTNAATKKIISKIIGKRQDDRTNIQTIYDYVLSKLNYGKPVDGLYSLSEVLSQKQVDCGGFVVLFCSLLTEVDISCLPVFGFYIGYEKNNMHAWAKMPSGDAFDPTSDYLYRSNRSFKSGGFGWVGSDHLEMSTGCNFDIDVDNHKKRVDILQKAVFFPQNKSVTITTDLLTDKKNA